MGEEARFSYPQRIALDKSGNLIVAGGGSHVLHHVTPQGKVSTLAGVGGAAGNADGQGAAARFNRPIGLAIDTASGDIFVGEVGGHLIRKVTKTGLVSTLAGMFTISTCVFTCTFKMHFIHISHACIHTYAYTHTYTRRSAHTRTRTHTHTHHHTDHTITHAYTQTRTYTFARAFARTHIRLHFHSYTHAHTRLNADRQVRRKGFCRRSR